MVLGENINQLAGSIDCYTPIGRRSCSNSTFVVGRGQARKFWNNIKWGELDSVSPLHVMASEISGHTQMFHFQILTSFFKKNKNLFKYWPEFPWKTKTFFKYWPEFLWKTKTFFKHWPEFPWKTKNFFMDFVFTSAESHRQCFSFLSLSHCSIVGKLRKFQ